MSVESRRKLSEIGSEYETLAASTNQVYVNAAKAEAKYKQEFAKAALRFKESGERMSVAEAELRADADDTIAQFYEDRLVGKAEHESLADILRSLKERSANGRTYIADERAADEMHARGGTP